MVISCDERVVRDIHIAYGMDWNSLKKKQTEIKPESDKTRKRWKKESSEDKEIMWLLNKVLTTWCCRLRFPISCTKPVLPSSKPQKVIPFWIRKNSEGQWPRALFRDITWRREHDDEKKQRQQWRPQDDLIKRPHKSTQCHENHTSTNPCASANHPPGGG